MAGRIIMKLDFSAYERMITEIEGLGGNIKGAVEEALKQAAETVQEDTVEAMEKRNLPAQGKYSHGWTAFSIATDITPKWSGTVASVNYGFNYHMPGAGGFLITGTPRMQPDYALEKIYAQKTYQKYLAGGVEEVLMDYLEDAFNGR